MICPEIFGFLILFVVQIVIVKSTSQVSLDPEDTSFTIEYLIKLKHPSLRSPYRKFGLTYDKFSVCELQFDQKVSVCEAVLSSKKFKYKMDLEKNEIMDLSCRRRMVNLSDHFQITNTKELSLSMYECPNPYKMENRIYKDATNEVKFFIPIHFFIIGGYFQNSVVLSYKHGADWYKGTSPVPIKFHTVFLDVSLRELDWLYILKRNEIYEKSTELKKFTKPVTRRVVGKEGTIQRNYTEADKKALGKDMIRTQSIYSRFVRTCNIINVCAMAKEKKLTLCRQILETSVYKLLVSEPEFNAMYGCVRRDVILLHPFAQSATTKMALIQCPTAEKLTTNRFFLGSMYQVRGVMAFMQIPPFLTLLPDAVVTGLNKDGLLKKPSLISLPKSKKKSSPLEDKLSVVND